MPLILLNGLPSSGKSTLSEQMLEYFKKRLDEEGIKRKVRIVSDNDSLDFEGRDSIFMSIPQEKELRSWLKAEAQRYVNLNQIVILDSAAYIKGFRYELHCIAKEAKTQYCVVELLIDQATCWKWNEERLAKFLQASEEKPKDSSECIKPGYSQQTFDALVMRYEKCDENNRWDQPLFRLNSENEKLDFNELFDTITKKEPLMPNKCTSLTTTTTTIYKPTK